jgi:hypothetical protein
MMAILPGMYAGASLGANISVPMMLPMEKVASVIEFIVLFFCQDVRRTEILWERD